MKTAARLVIAHASNTSHVFVYARVNVGSGVPPLGGCMYVTRRHVVLVDFVSPGWSVALVQQATRAAVAMPARLITRRRHCE